MNVNAQDIFYASHYFHAHEMDMLDVSAWEEFAQTALTHLVQTYLNKPVPTITKANAWTMFRNKYELYNRLNTKARTTYGQAVDRSKTLLNIKSNKLQAFIRLPAVIPANDDNIDTLHELLVNVLIDLDLIYAGN